MGKVFVFDAAKCNGCRNCQIACKDEHVDNDWSPIARPQPDTGHFWCRIEERVRGQVPKVRVSYVMHRCQHCENAACLKVCPTGATYKDDKGRVEIDYDKCIGCRMCMAACPYTGVRSFNWEEPKYPVDHAVGDADVPKHQKHVVEKCTFCYQRLAREEVPACMELCPARARHFGDFDDPDSEVSKLVKERSYEQLLASEGTKPSVYYLV